jgi:2-oxoglutarate ferredoxin oxidoreductase subunit alpha
MNYGQMVLEVERIVKGTTDIYHVGKINGEVISPDEILSKIKEVL